MNSSISQRRRASWVIGSFALCPCHLPLIFGAAVFSGPAVGIRTAHQSIAGTIVTLPWIAGTWRGLRHLRSASATTCPVNMNQEPVIGEARSKS